MFFVSIWHSPDAEERANVIVAVNSTLTGTLSFYRWGAVRFRWVRSFSLSVGIDGAGRPICRIGEANTHDADLRPFFGR